MTFSLRPSSVSILPRMAASLPDADPGALVDAVWDVSVRHAAIEHVLTKTALAQQSKDIYRAYVLEERPIGEVAKAFGVPNNSVSQIKTRVERMIADYEAMFAD